MRWLERYLSKGSRDSSVASTAVKNLDVVSEVVRVDTLHVKALACAHPRIVVNHQLCEASPIHKDDPRGDRRGVVLSSARKRGCGDERRELAVSRWQERSWTVRPLVVPAPVPYPFADTTAVTGLGATTISMPLPKDD